MAAKDVATHQIARIHSATIAIVAEQGYKALKVRDVARSAEVSTRAFYELFQSKEDCFLQTYDSISRRASRRIIAAQADERDWRKRHQLAFDEFLRGLEHKPQDARVALVEAYAAGIESLEQAWRTERIFEGMLTEAIARTPSGVQVPPLVIEAIVGGVISLSRNRLLTGDTVRLGNESNEIVEWALSLIHPGAAELAQLDRQAMPRATGPEPFTVTSSDNPSFSTGDRALILKATAEMVVMKGYTHLTPSRIRAAAGVSRSKFETYFDDVEGCYLDALEQHTGEALAAAARAQSTARSLAGGVYRAIAALCEHIANDAFLVRACLNNDLPPGPGGARSRQRLVTALSELLGDSMPPVSPTVTEVSSGALWSLFHHHMIRNWNLRREISATLGYLALIPSVGAPEALAAIRNEQKG
jgi:AcrR family transcriptional regulator